jgi:UDP-N-acetylmuramate dehydrogenase
MKIEKEKELKNLTTFRIGGKAEFFVEIRDADELHEALEWSSAQGLPYFVLGGGSNVLISDKGFAGLVIKNNIMGLEFLEDGTVIAGAGEEWDKVVEESVKRGLWGIENLSHVPGSAGAAPVQNIGCYGQELSETFLWAEVFDMHTKEIRKMDVNGCRFGYRNSVFKLKPGRYVVLRLALSLRKDGEPNLGYRDLAEHFAERSDAPSLKDIREALWHIRKRKGMVVSSDLPRSAGSFFKNPVVSKEVYEKLQIKYPEIVVYPVTDDLVKISAAYLIDKVCGLRGLRKGSVGINENQALAILNYGNAKAEDVDSLAESIVGQVKTKTGVELEREVQRVGFD